MFHPLIEKWFSSRFSSPTDIQEASWPRIASGEHLLLSAPTGSGKTLTAFLYGINQLITGEWEPGKVRLLYISPLKALNNDIRKNLMEPLDEIVTLFRNQGEAASSVHVMTRSGDSSPQERRKMLRTPPEILITTPESLHILLTSDNGRSLFTGLKCVVLDEIHAVLESKRGTLLMGGIERLVRLSGEFQRLAVSATVSPMEKAAGFVGGYLKPGVPRKVSIVCSGIKKKYRLTTSFPEGDEDSHWPGVIRELTELIKQARSTLVFTNSRRITEKAARLLNEETGELTAYAHHGALSREIRFSVEQKLKAGELPALIATSSLELGIDVGDLEQVVMVQTPLSAASAIQRIGRAGHSVGGEARGRMLPLFRKDLLSSAVINRAVASGDLEEIRIIENPLDVLAQIILSMTVAESWDVDELYDFLLCCYPFRELSKDHYMLVLNMLAGRYSETKIKELKPRLYWDKMENSIKAREGTAYLIYTSGGTIPDRGYYRLRLSETKAVIGELDEEFVWERSLGETFTLGTQLWRIDRITENDVEVSPAGGDLNIVPFWRGEDLNRSFFLSTRIGEFLEECGRILSGRNGKEELAKRLQGDYYFTEEAAETLVEYLLLQIQATRELPHRHQIIAEHYDDPSGSKDRKQVVLHTFWGGRVNRPFAMALSAAWEEREGYPLSFFCNNDCILLMLPHEFSGEDLLALLTPENYRKYLTDKLSITGFFGAKFRETAGISLLLPRGGFNKRMPLWLNRLRAKKVLEAVRSFKEFPVVLESWRSCLQDEFDLEALQAVLEEIQTGQICCNDVRTKNPSPFSDGVIWRQTNFFMYEDDSPLPSGEKNIETSLLEELFSKGLGLPEIPSDLVQELDDKLKSFYSGYTPISEEGLLEWLQERLVVPLSEWERILKLSREGSGDEELSLSQKKYFMLDTQRTGGSEVLVAAEENRAAVKLLLGLISQGDCSVDIPRETLFLQWMEYYAAILPGQLQDYGLFRDLTELLDDLIERGIIHFKKIIEGDSKSYYTTADNLERLLRMSRRSRAFHLEPLSIELLPLYLSKWQGVAGTKSDSGGLQQCMERLFGLPLSSELWEEAVFPSRMEPYFSNWLDDILMTSDLMWYGCGRQKSAFAFRQELDLFPPPKECDDEELCNLIPSSQGKYDLFDIKKNSGLSSGETSDKLWEALWAGYVGNDSYHALRQGILNKFKSVSLSEASRRGGRGAFRSWQSSRSLTGSWFSLPPIERGDLLDEQRLVQDRVRQLLDRYGILSRPLLAYELDPCRWGSVFKALKLMELSGELISGLFFKEMDAPQFTHREGLKAFQRLEKDADSNEVYWLNCCDPASLSGRNTPLKGSLPERRAGNWMVYQGSSLVMSVLNRGKKLEIYTAPDDPVTLRSFEFFPFLLTRSFNPVKRVHIEMINGENFRISPYKSLLEDKAGFRDNYNSLILSR